METEPRFIVSIEKLEEQMIELGPLDCKASKLTNAPQPLLQYMVNSRAHARVKVAVTVQ